MPSLYLFQDLRSAIYAVADDKAGVILRKHSPDSAWLLRAELARSEVAPTMLVWIDQMGYCLLEEDEVRSSYSRLLVRQQRG
jgi:hypothetical protein